MRKSTSTFWGRFGQIRAYGGLRNSGVPRGVIRGKFGNILGSLGKSGEINFFLGEYQRFTDFWWRSVGIFVILVLFFLKLQRNFATATHHSRRRQAAGGVARLKHHKTKQ